jgi:signal transduction histidine kinase/ligand-binding sensor domain-containing protein/DNA-binding response OmpR family regulator
VKKNNKRVVLSGPENISATFPMCGLIKLTIIFLFGILIFDQTSGQENRYVFSHLNVNDGLSQNQINCIFRDSKGFVWFGTNAGLNRFDGLSFEVFSEEKSENGSIKNSTINAIAEDKNGDLWIGTGNGVSVLNSLTYKFTDFDYRTLSPYSCGDIYYINTLTADNFGNIWIGTNNGVFYHDILQGSTVRILIDQTNCNLPQNSILSIVPDHSGNIWMSTKNGFIVRYDPVKKKIDKFRIPDESDKVTNSITRLFVDRDNDLWVGNLFGLYIFHIGSQKWETRFMDKNDGLEGLKRIGAISQNTDGMIWVASDGGGAFVFDKADREMTNIRHQPFDELKISSDGLSFVYCDSQGIVWLGTTKKGVNFYKKDINKFRIYRNMAGDPNSLSHNDANALVEDQKGNIWIGTDGGGLNYLDRKTQKITRFKHDNQSGNSLSSNIIVSLYMDHLNKLWIGTYFGGLDQYDPSTGKFSVYRHKFGDTTSVSDDRIYGINEDSQNNLWVGTWGNGLNLLDRRTGKFRRFTTQNSALCFDMITSIYRDKANLLWFSTEYGLSAFDSSDGRFKTYQKSDSSKHAISDNNVMNCFEDSRGFFWICTKNGLNLLDRKNSHFRHFSINDGLPSNSLHGIVEDKNRDLWISSKNGIARMEIKNVKNIYNFDFKITSYNVTDGLQGKEFNRSSALCTSDGEIFLGGPDGLNAFYPGEIKEDTSVAKMIFRDFRIFNKSVNYGQNYDGRILLEKPVFNTDKIKLKYRENSFTIEFIALNFFHPDKNKYAYKLEGFDNQWINTDGKNNSATYTNLNNGTYTFRVKELKGKSSGNEISLVIVVLPPFWKSWLAYILYVILISLLFVLLRRLILVRERINMRIEQERVEAQHIHEIDSLKLKLFTNISHELRTPLTLIMAPAEKLLSILKEKPEEKYLRLIEQNAKRLLLMVNQLLDFRKMEVQGFNYNPSFGDIVAFIREAVSSFNNLSEQKHIKLAFITQIKELNTYFDKDKLEKIIFNLLSNSFKFTAGNGQVTVSLFLEAVTNALNENYAGSKLFIEVEDTGIGIPADKIDKIFTRFFQADNTNQVEKGTGIGLSLVSEFVKLHGGEIIVRSEIGKGSCFTVILPVNQSEVADETTNLQEEAVWVTPMITTGKEAPAGITDRPSLLIAEDNDDLRFYLKDNLLGQFDILEAANGADALKMIQKIVPDLIISDIMMPGMDGIELCRRVKTDRSICHIPFILLTARSSEQQQLEGLETGADDYIKKPFNFQILEAKIINIINLRRNMRQVFKNKLHIEPQDITVTSLDEQFMKKVLDLVEKNISSADYSIEAMSHDMGMSRTLLYKKILALTGKSPLEFVRLLKLKRAAILLSRSQMNVSEIAFRVGFNDPKYFSKHFKNEFGVLPSRYVGKE